MAADSTEFHARNRALILYAQKVLADSDKTFRLSGAYFGKKKARILILLGFGQVFYALLSYLAVNNIYTQRRFSDGYPSPIAC